MALAEMHCAEASCRIATARNLIVYSWLDAPTLLQVRASGRLSRAMARKHRGGTGSLHVIAGGTPRFDEAVRSETAKIRGDATLSPLGVAEVVLVTGLSGVAARGFLSTVALIARAARPQKVFADLTSAAEWLAPKLSAGGEGWTPAEILAVVTEVSGSHRADRAERPRGGAPRAW
jgi:hypothetical protein